MEICSECRNRLPQGAEVCPSCGRPVTVAYVVPGEPGTAGPPPSSARWRRAGWAVGLLVMAVVAWAATREPASERAGGPARPTPGGGETGSAPSPARPASAPFELEGPLVLAVEDALGAPGVVLVDRDGRPYRLELRAPGTGARLRMLFAQEGFLVVADAETAWALRTGSLLAQAAAASLPEVAGPSPARSEVAVAPEPRLLLPLGRAGRVLPGAGGSVWLSEALRPGHFAVRRAPLGGEAIPEWVALPEGLRPAAGLRVGVAGVRGQRLEVWLPEWGRKAFEGGPPARILAAHEDLLAWVGPPCHGPCSLHLTDVRHGADVVVSSPDGVVELTGPAAFSPDGRTLALFARVPEDRAVLVLVQGRVGRVTVLRVGVLPAGVPPAADCSPCLAWFLSGRRLVFVTASGGLGAFETRTGTARALPLSLAGRVVGVAAP